MLMPTENCQKCKHSGDPQPTSKQSLILRPPLVMRGPFGRRRFVKRITDQQKRNCVQGHQPNCQRSTQRTASTEVPCLDRRWIGNHTNARVFVNARGTLFSKLAGFLNEGMRRNDVSGFWGMGCVSHVRTASSLHKSRMFVLPREFRKC